MSTSKNVFNLGDFFGNDDPAAASYNKVIPGLKKLLNYWKQFKLTQIGKARVVDIFLASKLLYVINFYPIPKKSQRDIQESIVEFVNFPQTARTISQKEMWKTKVYGGIKLVNVQIKSETTKAKWLIELASNPDRKLNLDIFAQLTGKQKGGISGRDLIFLNQNYMKYHLKISSTFYKEALTSVSILETKKGIPTVGHWDQEHIFYNPLFTMANDKVLTISKYCEKREVFILDLLLEEKTKETRKQPFDKTLTKIFDKIKLDAFVKKEDILITHKGDEIKFSEITQKQLYEESLSKMNTDHHSQVKWVMKLQVSIIWDDVWNAVHNFLASNETKTAIWQQLHLNFYTQYSYNKWHKTQGLCPLCQKFPQDIYHIILDCDFIKKVWEEIQPLLMELHSDPVTEEEMSLGIIKKKPTIGILLRNWITYFLRERIMREERKAYHSSGGPNFEAFKRKLNQKFHTEIQLKYLRYQNENNLQIFDKFITYENVLGTKTEENEYRITHIFSRV